MKIRYVKNHDKFYKIREDGKLWSCKVAGRGKGKERGPWKVLSPSPHPFGHLLVALVDPSGKTKHHYVHRLVLETFVGPCPPGMRARHYPDQNPTNNHISNLMWASNSRNQLDRRENGTSNQGERCGSAKLTEKEVRRIKKELALRTNGELSRKYKVSPATVSDIKAGRTWSHI